MNEVVHCFFKEILKSVNFDFVQHLKGIITFLVDIPA